MKTPPLLMGMALLFWGWQGGYLVAAVLMAAILECSRILPARWEFTDPDFDRIWNLCAVLFLGGALYAFTANQGPGVIKDLLRSPASLSEQKAAIDQTLRAGLVFTQWQPMIFFIFMAALAFSRRDWVDLSTFSWFLRWRRIHRRKPKNTPRPLNVSYPYFALCLASACIGRPESVWFYPGLCLLVGWALWPQRSQRFAVPVWAGLWLAAAMIGFIGSRGLYRFHEALRNYNPEWLSNLMQGGFDPQESRTALGHIGRLKGSGRIVLRVTPTDGHAAPPLLREAAYRTFRSPIWSIGGADKGFEPVTPEADETTWILLRQEASTEPVTIAGYLNRGHGLLALPNGAVRLEHLPVFLLRTNSLGAVRVDSGPGLVIFEAQYGPGATIDAKPGPEDLQGPDTESVAIGQIASELNLAGQTGPQTLRTVAAFFQDKFRYRTWLAVPPRVETNQTPLTAFLLESRAGHCEYFATATVLLLRQAGIPARYAVGYAVQEKAGRGYVVRQRHAHAWCLAYLDGAWHDFDTTPASWFGAEAARASLLESVYDAWSRFWFEFTKLRYGQSGLRDSIWWIVLIALTLSLGQLIFRKQWRRSRHEPPGLTSGSPLPGMDSEFYLIEKALTQPGLTRGSSETLANWLHRIRAAPSTSATAPSLLTVLRLHYRYRFDPAGLGAADRLALRKAAETCLAALRPER